MWFPCVLWQVSNATRKKSGPHGRASFIKFYKFYRLRCIFCDFFYLYVTKWWLLHLQNHYYFYPYGNDSLTLETSCIYWTFKTVYSGFPCNFKYNSTEKRPQNKQNNKSYLVFISIGSQNCINTKIPILYVLVIHWVISI